MKGIVLVCLLLFFSLLLCTIQEAKNYKLHEINATFICFFFLVSCFQRKLETQNYTFHEENFQLIFYLLCYPISLNFAPHEIKKRKKRKEKSFPSSFSYYQRNQIMHLMTHCFLKLVLLLFFAFFLQYQRSQIMYLTSNMFWGLFLSLGNP
jgi:hypothetical protein